ncbi:hypothetical protein IJJ27_04495 [bacterium]|nr:hypothetical protein [bacterium]
MLAQMKAHHEKLEKVLQEMPLQGQQWQLWLQFHQQQMLYFQGSQKLYVIAWVGAILCSVVALVASLVVNNWWLWVLTGMLIAMGVALGYYVSIVSIWLNKMQTQTVELFEKMVTIETKPNWAMIKFAIDLLGRWLKHKDKKVELEALDVWS